jgi:hypothetical protein
MRVSRHPRELYRRVNKPPVFRRVGGILALQDGHVMQGFVRNLMYATEKENVGAISETGCVVVQAECVPVCII